MEIRFSLIDEEITVISKLLIYYQSIQGLTINDVITDRSGNKLCSPSSYLKIKKGQYLKNRDKYISLLSNINKKVNLAKEINLHYINFMGNLLLNDIIKNDITALEYHCKKIILKLENFSTFIIEFEFLQLIEIILNFYKNGTISDESKYKWQFIFQSLDCSYQEIIIDVLLSDCINKSCPVEKYEEISNKFELEKRVSILSQYNLLRLYFLKFYIFKFYILSDTIKQKLQAENNSDRYLDVLLLELSLNETSGGKDKEFQLKEILAYMRKNNFLDAEKKIKCYYHLSISMYLNENYEESLSLVITFLGLSNKKYEIIATLGAHICHLLGLPVNNDFLKINLCNTSFNILIEYFMCNDIKLREKYIICILRKFKNYQLIQKIFTKEKEFLKLKKIGNC